MTEVPAVASFAPPGDDLADLMHPGLIDRRSRDAAELEGMACAYDKYVFRSKRKTPGTGWLTNTMVRRVHGDMFGDIWRWAGKYRTDYWAVGVEPHLIPEEINVLCREFASWDDPLSSMPVLEVAARLQNRLTRIHAFKSGNGRHACLMTDIYLYSRKHPIPMWPQFDAMENGDKLREQYIVAMIRADEDNYEDLMKFIGQLL